MSRELDKLRLESRNGGIQAEFVLYQVSQSGPESKLTPDLIREARRYRCAGHFRDGPVYIQGVDHEPPDHSDVPNLVDAMCNYVDQNWERATPVHIASYLMGRVNWTHPFFGGNGRTARAISRLMLCAKLDFALPRRKTVPELIVENRDAYVDALQAADTGWTNGEFAGRTVGGYSRTGNWGDRLAHSATNDRVGLERSWPLGRHGRFYPRSNRR